MLARSGPGGPTSVSLWGAKPRIAPAPRRVDAQSPSRAASVQDAKKTTKGSGAGPAGAEPLSEMLLTSNAVGNFARRSGGGRAEDLLTSNEVGNPQRQTPLRRETRVTTSAIAVEIRLNHTLISFHPNRTQPRLSSSLLLTHAEFSPAFRSQVRRNLHSRPSFCPVFARYLPLTSARPGPN